MTHTITPTGATERHGWNPVTEDEVFTALENLGLMAVPRSLRIMQLALERFVEGRALHASAPAEETT